VWEAAARAAPSVRPGDDDDGFGQRHFPRRRHEGAAHHRWFHVDDDALVAIVAQVVDQIAPADIQHGADRDEGREADVFLE
jgi:hypothetical protein